MSLRDVYVTALCAVIFVPVVACISFVSAQGMQSSSYRIESDSINFGGGLSTSTQYNLESTAGEIATGESASTNYNIKAGYQQMTTSFLSITPPNAVIMTPAISGVTEGEANGSTTVTIITDNSAGYQLSIMSSQTPALVSGVNSISDYVPVGVPDFNFTTNGDVSHFGYSPSGSDVAPRFKDNGSSCSVGELDTAFACWDGLSITEKAVAYRTSANNPNGSSTTINFRVGIGGNVIQVAGTYIATTTLTAITL